MNLADYLMDHGVLKRADAEKMAREIEGAMTAHEKQLKQERDQLEAKCQEMRDLLTSKYPGNIEGASPITWNNWHIDVKHALSSDCGKGWIKRMKALEVLAYFRPHPKAWWEGEMKPEREEVYDWADTLVGKVEIDIPEIQQLIERAKK